MFLLLIITFFGINFFKQFLTKLTHTLKKEQGKKKSHVKLRFNLLESAKLTFDLKDL